MGERLSGGNVALALLGNTLPTGAMLTVLILVLGPISGAHFNPLVSISAGWSGAISWRDVALYIVAQLIGAVIGVWVAHMMFDLSVLQVSTKTRSSMGQWVAEFVATFGLLITILACVTRPLPTAAAAVGLYISAAYWFTASTSFANPTVTLARSLSDTFAGISPRSVVPFIAAQFAGAIVAVVLSGLFKSTQKV
jgi:glycerol uptake facilitator-like aquaporin